jgi:hypothetical protein
LRNAPPVTALKLSVEVGRRNTLKTWKGAQANQLGDKSLRAPAVLAFASKCLEDAEKQEPQGKPKKHARDAKKQ